MEYSISQVVLMGLGTVFAGLIVIILCCYIMGTIMKFAVKQPAFSADVPCKTPDTNAGSVNFTDRKKFTAIISAAIAEESGEDISALRIKSIKKI